MSQLPEYFNKTDMRNRSAILSIRRSILYAAMVLALLTGCRNGNPQPQLNQGPAPAAENQFAVRGFHVDLRIQVMTVEALKAQIAADVDQARRILAAFIRL